MLFRSRSPPAPCMTSHTSFSILFPSSLASSTMDSTGIPGFFLCQHFALIGLLLRGLFNLSSWLMSPFSLKSEFTCYIFSYDFSNHYNLKLYVVHSYPLPLFLPLALINTHHIINVAYFLPSSVNLNGVSTRVRLLICFTQCYVFKA